MGNEVSNAAAKAKGSTKTRRNSKTARKTRRNSKTMKPVKAVDYRGTLSVMNKGKKQQVPDAKIGEELQQHILTELETYVEKYPSKDRDYSVRSNVPAGLIYVICDKPAPLKFTKDKKEYVIDWTAVAL